MVVRLSSKGQLIVPKAIRRSLSLKPGSQFRIKVIEDKIILEPLSNVSPVDQLYGKYAGTDLLSALEREHRLEVQDEGRLRS